MRAMNITCPSCNQTHPNVHVQIIDAGLGTYKCPINGQDVALKNFMPGAATMVMSPGDKADSYGDAKTVITIADVSRFHERQPSILSHIPDVIDNLDEAIYLGPGAVFGAVPANQGSIGDFQFTATFLTPNQQVTPSGSNVAQDLPVAMNLKFGLGDASQTTPPAANTITLNNTQGIYDHEIWDGTEWISYYRNHSSNITVKLVPANTIVRAYDPSGKLRGQVTSGNIDGATVTVPWQLDETGLQTSQLLPDQFGQPNAQYAVITFQSPGQAESVGVKQYYGSAAITSDNFSGGAMIELDIQPLKVVLNYYDETGTLVATTTYGGSQTILPGKQYNLKIDLTGQVLTASIWEANAVTPPMVLTLNTGATVIQAVTSIMLTHTNLLGSGFSSNSGWGTNVNQFDPTQYATVTGSNPVNWYLGFKYPALIAHATQVPLVPASTIPSTTIPS
jgi:hypothetical protein